MAHDRPRDISKQNYAPPRDLDWKNIKISDEAALGRGKFGVVRGGVMKGADGYDGQVAAKFGFNEDAIHGNTRVSTEVMGEIVREYDLLRTVLGHRNVLSVIGIIRDEVRPAIILERIDGGDLQGNLKKGRVSALDKIKFSKDAADGLAWIHDKGVIHRDIAARNCLLMKSGDEWGPLKIADFGLSVNVATTNGVYDPGQSGPIAVGWSAFESLDPIRPIWTKQSDVWSYGVLIYEMYHPRSYPYGSVLNEIDAASVRGFLESGGRLPMPASIGDRFRTLVKSCWNMKPENRPELADISALLADLIARFSPQQAVENEEDNDEEV